MNEPTSAADLTVLDKVAFLRRPESYPSTARDVQVIETHLSWVFLAGDHAYKFKKPARRHFVDFTTLAARRHNCEEEVRLNRRLAPDVYLGVVALARTPAGRLQLEGSGEPVEWLVKMRRLAEDRMLDTAIRTGAVDRAQLRGVARALSEFYRRTAPAVMSGEAYRARFEREIADNLRELRKPQYGQDPLRLNALEHKASAAFERLAPTLEARVAAGRIVEAHGDLRPEHICLGTVPLIIDCLEFSRELRTLDPLDELVHLALECERAGAAWIGPEMVTTYATLCDDPAPPALVAFYTAARALLRAKLCAWHIDDRAPAEHPRWIAAAGEYLDLAATHLTRT